MSWLKKSVGTEINLQVLYLHQSERTSRVLTGLGSVSAKPVSVCMSAPFPSKLVDEVNSETGRSAEDNQHRQSCSHQLVRCLVACSHA